MGRDKKSDVYIYIITNPSWDGWVKIGRCCNLEIRLSQYQTYSPLRDYRINFSILSKRPSEIESYFDRNIIGKNEWFYISVDDAIDIINKIETGIEIQSKDIPPDCIAQNKDSIHAIYKYKIIEIEDEYSYMEAQWAQSLREVAEITRLQIGDLSTKFAQSKYNSINMGKYEIKRSLISTKHSLN